MRKAEGPRHIDIDGMQVCPHCHFKQMVSEATAARRKNTTWCRELSKQLNCWFVWVKHEYMDLDNTKPVHWVAQPPKKSQLEFEEGSDWESLKIMLEAIYYDPAMHEPECELAE